VPAQVPAGHAVTERRRIRERGGDKVTWRNVDTSHAHRLGRVEPELVQRLQTSMNSLAEPVLEGDAVAVDPPRHQHDLLVLDVDAPRAGPIPSGKSNTSGSEKGSVVNQPRSRSR